MFYCTTTTKKQTLRNTIIFILTIQFVGRFGVMFQCFRLFIYLFVFLFIYLCIVFVLYLFLCFSCKISSKLFQLFYFLYFEFFYYVYGKFSNKNVIMQYIQRVYYFMEAFSNQVLCSKIIISSLLQIGMIIIK